MGKQQIVIYLCMLIGLFIYGFQHITYAKGKSNLLQIVDVYKEQGIAIKGWSIYGKELIHGIDEDLLEEKLDALLEAFPQASWEIERNGQEKQITISLVSAYQEKIMLTLMDDGNLYTIYQAHGNNWNDKQWNEIEMTIEKTTKSVFVGEPTIFSCVQGVSGDIIKNGMQNLEKKLMNNFDATPVESVTEGSFVSVSAYTEQWKDALPTGKKNVNLQIAIREDKQQEQTNITIGTPIITTEY